MAENRFNVGDLVVLNEKGTKWWPISESDYPSPDDVMVFCGMAKPDERNRELAICFIIGESRYYEYLYLDEIELYSYEES